MHNSYVEILAKTGLFGACLYGGGLVAYLKAQSSLIKKNKQSKNMKATTYLIGGLAGTISCLLVYFAAPLSSFGYVFIPGMIGLIYARLSESEATQVQSPLI